MQTARSNVAHFECSARSQCLLNLQVPLVNVLRRSVRIKCCETHGGGRQCACAEHRSAEIQTGREQGRRRREIVSLLCLREDVRNVVALVTPRILIDRSKEEPIAPAKHQTNIWQIFREPEAWGDVVLV